MQTIEIEGPAAAPATVPATHGRGARHTGRGPGSRNLAASAGAWSARHRRKAIFAWLVLVVAAYTVGSLVGQRNLTDAQMGNGQSATALSVFEKAFPYHNGEEVLIQARGSAAAGRDGRPRGGGRPGHAAPAAAEGGRHRVPVPRDRGHR